jgi:thymidylate synthase (FAD)
MQVELIAYTQANPALTPEAIEGRSDLATIANGHGTYPEKLIEYAGRVCYRSTHRMGTAPSFIAARVREGHEDIIEHVVVTLRFRGDDAPREWRLLNRHCEISRLGEGDWLVSGNTRVWLDFFRKDVATEAIPLLQQVTPKVYAEFGSPEGTGGDAVVAASSLTQTYETPSLASLEPAENGPMRVTLLGFTRPQLDDPDLALHHGSATFFFEGISRTCPHQLVRHRLASFSQESQRYVNLSKGNWNAVIPPAVADDAKATAIIDAFWADAEEKYAELRSLGIRKEDARFLLPNAAETRIVTTMNFAAWSHFLWLRAVDKAAQWEIRAMGQRVLEMLYAIAPDVFQAQWDAYQEMR